jgi:hypothetical protein
VGRLLIETRRILTRSSRALVGLPRGALLALTLLLAAAVAVRAWLMIGYGPGFLGFGDSHEYVVAADVGVFHDVQKPAGYPIFLALAHALSDRLAFTIALQHVLGLAAGLLLLGAVRRAGAPLWAALFPAAIVFFGGTGVLLEHSLLADPLFSFLQALALYAAARALLAPSMRWSVLAGAAGGACFWVKTVGLAAAILVPCALLLAGAGARANRRAAAVAAGMALVVVLGYFGAQAFVTGYRGYERQGAWNLYGRVASFVDCSRFTPPPGTRFLCPAEPLSRRAPASFYQYARAAPAVARFGGPARAPGYANGVLQRFSIAAITHEPLAYAGTILSGLTFYLFPRSGEGYTPAGIRAALLDRKGTGSIEPSIAAYYPHARGYRAAPGATGPLDFYEAHTRIEGALLIAMLLAALGGPALLRARRTRAAAVLFTLTAICSVTLAEAGNGYDARYAYAAFGPLAAGAALGAWGLVERARAPRRLSVVERGARAGLR